MFCIQCGNALPVSAKFCSNCGIPVGQPEGATEPTLHDTVSLLPSQRRVRVGALFSEVDTAEDPKVVPVGSEEALNANLPFDASRAPDPGGLVPGDCVWAFVPHPGAFPGKPSYGSIDARFVAMGNLVGRTYSEIVTAVGLPMTNIKQGQVRSAVWGKTSLWSGIWQINLVFDPYDVCMNIGSETSLAL